MNANPAPPDKLQTQNCLTVKTGHQNVLLALLLSWKHNLVVKALREIYDLEPVDTAEA